MDTSSAVARKEILKLSAVFALIYFFSPNGLAALPGITTSFLLKDVLQMSATQAAYFGAITLAGWVLKPLWGIISDALPLFGYRRRSYLLVTALGAAAVWALLGQIDEYSIKGLLLLFSLSSALYAFMDVICDALMVETGKPLELTGRFQSIQWTAVYIASILTGLLGGWVAVHLTPQLVYATNAVFPLFVLAAVVFFIKEPRVEGVRRQFLSSFAAVRGAFSERGMWLLSFFIFFVAFSPSFGAPFFYYAVDTLKFKPVFLGVGAAVGGASAAVGAILYGRLSARIRTRPFLYVAIGIAAAATFFDLIYFISYVREHLMLARGLYVGTSALLSAVSALAFLTILNAAALATPKGGEGTTFAVLMSFWNIGVVGAGALGGWLFSKIGLPPLIVTSALFTAAAWLILPYLKFADDRKV